MSRSSAKFISYDLRPAKQSERRLLLDILKMGADCGLSIDDYRYVGLGANRFYDFLLIHKYLGIKSMVSLEHDPVMYKRAKFNVPWRFIELLNTTTDMFIASDQSDEASVYWFDYDGQISNGVLSDIAAMSTKMRLGDYCFVTTYGGMPRFLEKCPENEKLKELHDRFGDITLILAPGDVEWSNFQTAVHKLLFTAFKNAFSSRLDGVFVPLLQVEYSDSQTMVTVGGAFLQADVAERYRVLMKKCLSFLDTVNPSMYKIRSFNLTDKERRLFDRAVTSQEISVELRSLEALGFPEADITSYRELVRYLPRYFESIV